MYLSPKLLLKLLIINILFFLPLQSQSAEQVITEFETIMQQHQGKVIYLDFWASWCVPCRKSFPWMNEMQSTYKNQGLVILSINLDREKPLAETFLKETPADFAIIYDEQGTLAKRFQLKGMPSSYIFNRQGEMVSAHHGFNGEKQKKYESELKKLLAQL